MIIKYLIILIFIPSVIFSKEKNNLFEYNINITVSDDTIFINTLLKGEFKGNLLLLNSLSNIRHFKINEKVGEFTFSNDTLSYLNEKMEVNSIRIDYFFIKNDYSLDSIIILKNEGLWFPRISNSIFNYKLDINYKEKEYYLISANKNNNYFGVNKSSISVLFLPKNTYKIFKLKNNKIEYNYYSLKEIKIDSLFINEFIYSSNYFINFFNKKVYNTLNIIQISSKKFNICQSLNQCIIFGDYFYNLHTNFPKNSWIPHEVCHQWWGRDLLFNNKSINYRFIEESFTEYLKYTYINNKYGMKAFNDVIDNSRYMYDYVINDTNVVSIRSIEKLNNQVNNIVIYCKGPLLLNYINNSCDMDINDFIKDIYKEYNNTMLSYNNVEEILKSFDEIYLPLFNDLLNSKKDIEYHIANKQ